MTDNVLWRTIQVSENEWFQGENKAVAWTELILIWYSVFQEFENYMKLQNLLPIYPHICLQF